MKQFTEEKSVQYLSYISATLVLLLAFGGFLLSYNALRNVALQNGYPPALAAIWPLLVDAALVIFSLAIVRASLLQERVWWPWVLVGVFTAGTIVFNYVHATDNLTVFSAGRMSISLRQLVGIVPPITLVLAFETLMGMLKSSVRRHLLVKSSNELQMDVDKLQEEKDRQQVKLDRIIATRQATIDKLTGRVETIKAEIETKKKALTGAGRQSVVILGDLDPKALGNQPAKRQPLIRQMLEAGMMDEDIRATFNISPKTLGRDKRALATNGQGTNGTA